ncbi:MAG: ACP S-malonyltransferase [Thermodesulfobacteriota bacterium]|nr:ACP S-malonyltransferase [Thermodesulfobacteriota bacterium]
MNDAGIVFPGQGSQYVGMGKDLYEGFQEARETFAEAAKALGIDIARLCFEGPRDVLDLTSNTQPAVLTVDVAIYRIFEKEIGIEPAIMAGHSLGEYAALCASGAIDFSDAVSLVHARGRYQQEAVPPGEGCMAAILGLDRELVEEICRVTSGELGVVALVNINSPGQSVISGNTAAVEKAVDIAKERGVRMGVKLPISVPCHCSLLDKAAEKLEKDLDNIRIRDCRVKVIPNFDPENAHSTANTRKFLARQLNSPVRWQETVERMYNMGIRTIVEIGPKRTLSSLIKRIDRRIKTLNIEDMASLESAIAFFNGDKTA